jgi:tRNA A-37 threonylcarbamoyl transferase component Bud32
MSNAASPGCPQCGVPIKPDAPAGLCPNCLMALNLKTETVFTGDSSATQPPLTPEQLAPHFPQLEILECLGRGGMGVVYKARQKSLNRFVALKLLAPERVTDARFAERFTREAHALAALNHPHIVTVYDFGEAGGFYFLLMEFVDGVNLRQLLQARKLKPEEALAIVPPLCDALQYAHEHGIVHRDIKPANLLLDKAGRVKIADFGIAKIVGEISSAGVAESQPAGTPQYMAPEQKAQHTTDHRADIYSLGVVLYEMLTGELPADKLQPPSRKVQIDVRLDEIVLRALEKTPELRFATAAEFRTQVEAVTAPAAAKLNNPRISQLAVVGACWVPVAIAAIAAAWIVLSASRDGVGPLGWQLGVLIPLLILAVGGPFGTTILGWLAVTEISRSQGRTHGLQLAVFDGLVYPLMALSAILAGGVTYAIGAVTNQPSPGRASVMLAVAITVVVNVFIVRAVMRAVRREAAAAPREGSVAGNQIKLASLALTFALLSVALGALAAMRSAGVWPAMALAFVFAGVAIFMALPVRRLGAGKSALIVASLGVVIWPLAALVIGRANTTAASNSFRPLIDRVEISNERAIVRQPRFAGEGMIFLFGTKADRWTPGGLYLDTMFDVTLGWRWLDRGANWIIKTRHGTYAFYRLDGPPGPMLGKIVFHSGTAALEPDGSYVIGEFKPDNGEPLPISVKLEKTEPAPSKKASVVAEGEPAPASNGSVSFAPMGVLLLCLCAIALLVALVPKSGPARKVALGVLGGMLLLFGLILSVFIAWRSSRAEKEALMAAQSEAFHRSIIERARAKPRQSNEPAFLPSSPGPTPGVDHAPRAEAAVPGVHTATREGSYDLGNGVTFVVTIKPPSAGGDGKNPGYYGRLDWPKSAANGKAASTDLAISNGNPFVAAWEAGSSTLWVACGSAEEEPALAYLQEIKIRGPGDVETIGHSLRDADGIAELPAGIREAFNATGVVVPAPVTKPGHFLKQTRQ